MKRPQYEKPPRATRENIDKIMDDFVEQLGGLIVKYEYNSNPLNFFSTKD
jgi:hypothetical protein